MDPITIFTVLKTLIEHGLLGAIAVLFIVLYRIERKHVDIANKQIANLNEKRGEEIRLMAEALTCNSEANHDVARSLERLYGFIIEKKIGEKNE